jgi:hypothetical protein
MIIDIIGRAMANTLAFMKEISIWILLEACNTDIVRTNLAICICAFGTNTNLIIWAWKEWIVIDCFIVALRTLKKTDTSV